MSIWWKRKRKRLQRVLWFGVFCPLGENNAVKEEERFGNDSIINCYLFTHDVRFNSISIRLRPIMTNFDMYEYVDWADGASRTESGSNNRNIKRNYTRLVYGSARTAEFTRLKQWLLECCVRLLLLGVLSALRIQKCFISFVVTFKCSPRSVALALL